MEDIIKKQKLLMDSVPHPLTPENASISYNMVDVIEKLILYANSLGRKPWRPEPLSEEKQKEYKDEVKFSFFNMLVQAKQGEKLQSSEEENRMMVSALGIIEETIECFRECVVGHPNKPNRPKTLEEYVDILFFWAELGIENQFSWQEIKREYDRKWAVNMKRYADSKKGDNSWDDRKDKNTL